MTRGRPDADGEPTLGEVEHDFTTPEDADLTDDVEPDHNGGGS